jgi:hypothetical protein
MSWGKGLEIEPQVSGNIGALSLIGSTRYITTSVPNPAIGESTVVTRSLVSALHVMAMPMNGVLLSLDGHYNHREQRFESIEASTFLHIAERFGVTLSYAIPGTDWKHGTLMAQLNVNLGGARITSVSSLQGESIGSSVIAQGSALVSPYGVRLYDGPGVGESVDLVEAYHDRNANGVRDHGEETLDPPNASLAINGSQLTTSDGVFHSLPANRQCVVEIDRFSHAADDLFPSVAMLNLQTVPNGAFVMEVPFGKGVDCTGSIRVEGYSSSSIVDGLRITLENSTGASFDGEVYADGTIFVPAVCFGHYTLRFDNDQLASRRLAPLEIAPVVDVTSESHRFPAIVLRRK